MSSNWMDQSEDVRRLEAEQEARAIAAPAPAKRGRPRNTDMNSSAILSPCGKYRFLLRRSWNPALGGVNFVMLNPSTADAREDDPTIRKCIAFAALWGFGSLVVTNLVPFRATDPKEMKRHWIPYPTTIRNEVVVSNTAKAAALVVVAWGKDGGKVLPVGLAKLDRVFHCLGRCKDGSPKHPLYLAATTKPQEWVR